MIGTRLCTVGILLSSDDLKGDVFRLLDGDTSLSLVSC